MTGFRYYRKQRGVTLIVGLIMLALIMLSVTTAFTLSSTNLKSVGNMQFRNEAISAANKAIEQVIGSAFTDAPTAEEINYDINNDGTTDYVVSISAPTCIRAAQLSTVSSQPSSTSLGLVSGMNNYNTMWEIVAVVSDTTTGASVTVRQGVRVLLNQTELNSVCA